MFKRFFYLSNLFAFFTAYKVACSKHKDSYFIIEQVATHLRDDAVMSQCIDLSEYPIEIRIQHAEWC